MTSFLLFDIRETEASAELLNEEGAFKRLMDLISSPTQHEDVVLHRMLMELLYEMSRIQRIRPNDLGVFKTEWTASHEVAQYNVAES